MRTRCTAWAAAALCGAVLSACGSSPGSSTDPDRPGTAQPGNGSTPGPDGGQAEVIATRTARDGRYPVAFLLHGLKREGELLTLTFSLENQLQVQGEVGLNDAWTPGDFVGDLSTGDFGNNVAAIYLIDKTNRKKHLRARDSNGICVCTRNTGMIRIDPGQAERMFSTFAAPPPGIDKLDIVIPHFGTILGAPIG